MKKKAQKAWNLNKRQKKDRKKRCWVLTSFLASCFFWGFENKTVWWELFHTSDWLHLKLSDITGSGLVGCFHFQRILSHLAKCPEKGWTSRRCKSPNLGSLISKLYFRLPALGKQNSTRITIFSITGCHVVLLSKVPEKSAVAIWACFLAP